MGTLPLPGIHSSTLSAMSQVHANGGYITSTYARSLGSNRSQSTVRSECTPTFKLAALDRADSAAVFASCSSSRSCFSVASVSLLSCASSFSASSSFSRRPAASWETHVASALVYSCQSVINSAALTLEGKCWFATSRGERLTCWGLHTMLL